MTGLWPALAAAWVFVNAWALSSPASPATPAARYADGAPPGFSGGFKEESCDACHFENASNVPPGELRLTGVPERYTPGARYELAVTLTRPGLKIGGFQLTARTDTGAQAGTLAPAAGEDKRVAIDAAGGVQYARQRRDGAVPAPTGIARWEVSWTAPPTATPVQFHVAANAGDNDESVRGDYVYTAVVTTRP